MGYFDFLDQDEPAPAPQPTPSPNPPNITEFQRKRSALADAIRDRAIQYVESFSPRTDADDSLSGSIFSRLQKREIPPEQIPGEVEKFVKRGLGSRLGASGEVVNKEFDPELSRLGSEYLRLEATPEADQLRKMLSQQDAPNLQSRMSQLDKITQDLPFEVTEAGRKRLKEQQKLLQDSVESSQKFAGPPEQLRQMMADRDSKVTTTSVTDTETGTPENVMEANGVPTDEYYRGITELAEKLGVSLDKPVNFGVGLSRVLSEPDMQDVRAEFQQFMEGMNKPTMKAQTPSTYDKNQPAPQVDELEGERQMKKLDIQELGRQQELQSWGEVLSFVLLSMVIGPNLAFLFFSNAAKKGVLRNQIGMRKERIKELERDQKFKAEQDNEYKKMAIQQQRDRESKAEERSYGLREKLFLKAADAFFKAKDGAGSDEMKAFLDGREKAFRRLLTIGGNLEEQARQIEAQDPAKASSLREQAQTFTDEAELIHDEIEKLNARRFSQYQPEPEEAEADSE